jgi:transcriptional regulator with XRE-family HTH domain
MGRKLQRFRQEAGMSQSQLAKAANVPIGTLRSWEYDRREPLLSAAARVAKVLGVSLDVLAADLPRKKK